MMTSASSFPSIAVGEGQETFPFSLFLAEVSEVCRYAKAQHFIDTQHDNRRIINNAVAGEHGERLVFVVFS